MTDEQKRLTDEELEAAEAWIKRAHRHGLPFAPSESEMLLRLVAEARRLRAVLSDLEWAKSGMCPQCGADAPHAGAPSRKHHRGCALAVALGRPAE